MRRILPVLAFVIAAGVVVVAIIELDGRSDTGGLAIPTLAPALSPAVVGPTVSPRVTARPSPRRTAKAAATNAPTPAPSFSRTPEPRPMPERTAAPPRTPTPSPEPTPHVGPIDKSNGATPHTGGNSVPAGVALAVAAIASRARSERQTPVILSPNPSARSSTGQSSGLLIRRFRVRVPAGVLPAQAPVFSSASRCEMWACASSISRRAMSRAVLLNRVSAARFTLRSADR